MTKECEVCGQKVGWWSANVYQGKAYCNKCFQGINVSVPNAISPARPSSSAFSIWTVLGGIIVFLGAFGIIFNNMGGLLLGIAFILLGLPYEIATKIKSLQ
jgi:hypothetical protein